MSTKKPRKKLGTRDKRSAINISKDQVVNTTYLQQGKLPLVVEPAFKYINLIDWAKENGTWIEKMLYQYGGVLFRGFQVANSAEFLQFLNSVSDKVIEYKERSSPRSTAGDKIYTSTDYPPRYSIFLHNELSYSHSFPLKIAFYCLTAPPVGGETPIADCRKVMQHIDPKIRKRFVDKGWMYVRNFGDGFGLPWRTVFQTEDKSTVEAYCRQNNIAFEWKAGDRLRTRQIRSVIETHPITGEEIWFNHLTFYHVLSLEPEVREALTAEFSEEELPNNTYYGDGRPIEPDVIEHLREAYLKEKIVFRWQKGDILLLDNMIAAHAREPFEGERAILVGMAELHTRVS